MRIRKAKENDKKIILKLLNSSSELQTIAGKLDYDIKWVESVIKNKKLHICLVAVEKDEIVGVLLSSLWPATKESFTIDLIIKKKFRGKGIATELNKKYEKILKNKNYDSSFSFVSIKNKKMQKLKSKLGYKKGKTFYFYGKILK